MTQKPAAFASLTHPWLGVLTRQQYESALARFDLGDLVKAEPVQEGVWGQNVFLTTSRGEFVFRGRPVLPGQFDKEAFAVSLLHRHGRVPVAYPYLLDSSCEIFPWPYVIMPRLRGVAADGNHLTEGEQVWVARAMGTALAAIHESTNATPAVYDLDTNDIVSITTGYGEWMMEHAHNWLRANQTQGFINEADSSWADRLITGAANALSRPFRPSFVVGDYHPGNVLVDCLDGEWVVTGVFDLSDYHFGDGEADLTRTTALHVGRGELHFRLASAFAREYLAAKPPRPEFAERFAFYMLLDRLQVWEHGKRLQREYLFAPHVSFREYAEPFTRCHTLLV